MYKGQQSRKYQAGVVEQVEPMKFMEAPKAIKSQNGNVYKALDLTRVLAGKLAKKGSFVGVANRGMCLEGQYGPKPMWGTIAKKGTHFVIETRYNVYDIRPKSKVFICPKTADRGTAKADLL